MCVPLCAHIGDGGGLSREEGGARVRRESRHQGEGGRKGRKWERKGEQRSEETQRDKAWDEKYQRKRRRKERESNGNEFVQEREKVGTESDTQRE